MGIAIKKKAAPEEAQKTITKEATAVVTKQHPDGTEEQEPVSLGQVTTTKQPALVHIDFGMTKNLGNYESLKFNVGITIPCEPTAEDIDATYHEARAWVDDKVNSINEEVETLLK